MEALDKLDWIRGKAWRVIDRVKDRQEVDDALAELRATLTLLAAEAHRAQRLREAATRLVGAHSREVIARAKWANEPEPWSPESRQMFEAVLAREAETADAALAVGAIVFPDETARLTAALETPTP